MVSRFNKTAGIAGLTLGVVLLLTGCAGESKPPVSEGAQSETVESEVGQAKPANPADYKVSGEWGVKPEIVIAPEAGNVTELYTKTIIEGSGEQVVKAGDTVTVQYVGLGGVSHKQFDSSWDNGQPLSFSLDQVIPGWAEGLEGAKVGERRLIVIPGDKAYGSVSPTPDIQPDETLIFVVDVISIP